MDTQEVWASAFGREPLFLRFSPLFHSIVYYAIVVFAHIFLFKLNTVFSPKWLQSFLGDFLCTITACSMSFQNSIVRSNYGPIAYILVAALMTLLQRRVFKNSVPSLLSNVQKYLSGSFPFWSLLLRAAVHILAIPATITFLHMIWMLELMPEHVEKRTQQTCNSNLNVAVTSGFFIEGGAMMFNSWLNRVEITHWPLFDSYFKIFVNPIMVTAGLSLTGMYMNPILASIATFGCKGITPSQHIIVYWVAPIVGCVCGQKLAAVCKQQTKQQIKQSTEEKQKKNGSPERLRKFRRRSRGTFLRRR